MEQLSFNNFEVREIYSNPDAMKSLEHRLLGWDKDDEVVVDDNAK